MFPGGGEAGYGFLPSRMDSNFFSCLILSRRFRKIWPREKNSFHCWPRIWRWRSGASPWEIASSSSRNAGSLFASGHQKKEYRIQWNCPMVPGVSGSLHGFSGPTMCSSFHERPQDMDGTFSNSVPRRSRVFSSSQVQDRNWKFHSGGSVVMSPCRAIFKMSWSG